MSGNDEKAWHEGYNAGAEKQLKSENPYLGSEFEEDWLAGWHKGGNPDCEENGNRDV